MLVKEIFSIVKKSSDLQACHNETRNQLLQNGPHTIPQIDIQDREIIHNFVDNTLPIVQEIQDETRVLLIKVETAISNENLAAFSFSAVPDQVYKNLQGLELFLKEKAFEVLPNIGNNAVLTETNRESPLGLSYLAPIFENYRDLLRTTNIFPHNLEFWEPQNDLIHQCYIDVIKHCTDNLLLSGVTLPLITTLFCSLTSVAGFCPSFLEILSSNYSELVSMPTILNGDLNMRILSESIRQSLGELFTNKDIIFVRPTTQTITLFDNRVLNLDQAVAEINRNIAPKRFVIASQDFNQETIDRMFDFFRQRTLSVNPELIGHLSDGSEWIESDAESSMSE